MKRRLVLMVGLVAALAFGALASAQNVRFTGGLDIQPLTPSVAGTASIEKPLIHIYGVTAGPIATINFKASPAQSSAEILIGIDGTLVLPNTNWGVDIKLLLQTSAVTGQPTTTTPDLQVSFVTTF